MAAILHKLESAFNHHDHPHSPLDRQDSDMERALEEEKRALAHWEDQKRPLSPDQIDGDANRKPVGFSSALLSQEHFELVKTLGTGTRNPYWIDVSSHSADTHARNLCARLARPLRKPAARRP